MIGRGRNCVLSVLESEVTVRPVHPPSPERPPVLLRDGGGEAGGGVGGWGHPTRRE